MRVFLSLSAALIAIAAGITFLQVTTITSITSTPPLTDTYTHQFKGKNLLLLSSSDVVDTVLRQYPLLDSVSITKQFPGTLVIHTTVATPFVQLTASNSALIISSKGKVLSDSDNERLPRIHYYGDIPAYMRRIGSTITFREITYALKLIARLNDNNERPQEVRIASPRTIELQLTANAPTYLLTTQKNIDKNSQLVHNIQEMLKREGIAVSRVDMRYDKPILIK
ncbi:MAG: FtsQ-type POTRA domain-containing protein [Candidatus Roizmanbacteria bacterium]|nr:FtsQ-type POTRA domain-containing protein [Candidatus Roizmanbacteria bacterium]